MDIELDLILNQTSFRFFVKMIGTKSLKHSKNKFQDQIRGYIENKKRVITRIKIFFWNEELNNIDIHVYISLNNLVNVAPSNPTKMATIPFLQTLILLLNGLNNAYLFINMYYLKNMSFTPLALWLKWLM